MSEESKKVGLVGLISLTVSSVIGGGIYHLMTDVANKAALVPAMLALLLSGLGMGIFVFCLQYLNDKLPKLNAGIYSYAQEGFGHLTGFISAFGYWLSMLCANVALGSFAFSGLGHFFPILGDGSNLYSVIFASITLWIMHWTILKGSRFASLVNLVITAVKLIPLAIFIILSFIAFKMDVFTSDLWGQAMSNWSWDNFFAQVSNAMVVIVWVYVGIEGAIVYSARAKSRKIVSKANVLGFALITLIYLAVVALSYGIMTRAQLMGLAKPAMGQIMEMMVGHWGAVLINGAVAVSATGAWFACTMFSGEVVYQAAREEVFPKIFLGENENGAPAKSLLITNILVQIFFLSLLINKSAYNFMALLASSTMLVPYFFVSLSQVKLAYKWGKGMNGQVILGIMASLYMGFCILATGWQYFLVTSLLFAPGMLIFYHARRQRQEEVFTKAEKIAAILLILLAILSIVLIAIGWINIRTL